MITWVTENWQNIVGLAGALVMGARIVIKLTPTPVDDGWLARVVSALKAIGLHLD